MKNLILFLLLTAYSCTKQQEPLQYHQGGLNGTSLPIATFPNDPQPPVLKTTPVKGKGEIMSLNQRPWEK